MNLLIQIISPPSNWEINLLGDQWFWKNESWEWLPNTSCVLSYNARLQGAGSTAISITSSESDNDYLVEVASATRASYTAGTYSWSTFITRSSDSQRIQIDSGDFVIKTNLATSTADPRTQPEQMVDHLESTPESLAQKLTTSYSVSDWSKTLTSMEDVRNQLDYYKGKVRSEVNKARVKSG